MNEDSQQTHVMSLIVSQLKSYGYYSLAKSVADQTGTFPSEPSNKLQEACKNVVLNAQEKSGGAFNAGSGNIIGNIGKGMVWDGKHNSKKVNPNYRTWFNTQHREFARAVAFSDDGNFIATGSQDTSLKVLDTAVIMARDSSGDEKKVIKTLYDHTGPVNEVAFHPNGAVLASCSDDGNIKFYDLQKQNTKRGFRYLADVYPVRSISFHPSGEFIISGTDHHSVRMFDIQSMKLYIPPAQNDHHSGAITRVRFSPNGATFASCSVDGSIKLYETVSGKCINTISKAHNGASVIGITYSKSSAYLLSTGLDSKGKLWDLSSGKLLCTYAGGLQKFDHAPMVFSNNEDYVIGTDASNHTIVIWDSQTGEIMRKMKSVHDAPIHQIAASPTDPGFMSAGDDCRARKSNLSCPLGMKFESEKENSQNSSIKINMSHQIPRSSKKRLQLSISERRELRANYRNLNDETEDKRADIMAGSASILVQQIKKGNQLFQKVDATQEAVMDAEFLLKAANIAKDKARQLKVGGQEFDFAEYMSKVLWKKNREGWASIREIAKEICTLIPSIGFMLGAVKIDLKDKKARKATAKLDRSSANIKRPELITDKTEADFNETSHNVQHIHRILESLCEDGPIPFYTFFINPFSFSQSVENLFYISFLIRDGIVYISESEDDQELLLIETCEPPTAEQLQDRENQLAKIQNVIHFDMGSWKHMIETYSIKDCIIPNREPVPDANALSWS